MEFFPEIRETAEEETCSYQNASSFMVGNGATFRLLHDAFYIPNESHLMFETNFQQPKKKKRKKPRQKTNQLKVCVPQGEQKILFPRPSSLNVEEQKDFLKLYIKFNKSDHRHTPAEQQHYLRYMALQQTVNEENKEFQKFVLKQCESAPKFTLELNIDRYITNFWMNRVLMQLKTYPRYYKRVGLVPLVFNEKTSVKCKHVAFIKSTEPFTLLRSPEKKKALPSMCRDVTKMVQMSSTTDNIPPVSEDPEATKLALSYGADIVISSSGLKHIADNFPPFNKTWHIPVVIRDLIDPVTQTTKKVVFVDKALPPRTLTDYQKNYWYHKIATKMFLYEHFKSPESKTDDDSKNKNATVYTTANTNADPAANTSGGIAQEQEAIPKSDVKKDHQSNINEIKHVETNSDVEEDDDDEKLIIACSDDEDNTNNKPKVKKIISQSNAGILSKNIDSLSIDGENRLKIDQSGTAISPGLSLFKADWKPIKNEANHSDASVSQSSVSYFETQDPDSEIDVNDSDKLTAPNRVDFKFDAKEKREGENNSSSVCLFYNLWVIGKSSLVKKDMRESIMKGAGNEREIKVLVRNSVPGTIVRDTKMVPLFAFPKMEYKSMFGAEVLSPSEIVSSWVSMYFRNYAECLRVRTDALSSEVLMFENTCVKHLINNYSEQKPHLQDTIQGALYNVLVGLVDTNPGRYLLAHTPNLGSFATLMKAQENDGPYDLQQVYKMSATQEQAPIYQEIDARVILPRHLETGRVPCTFYPIKVSPQNPKKNQQLNTGNKPTKKDTNGLARKDLN